MEVESLRDMGMRLALLRPLERFNRQVGNSSVFYYVKVFIGLDISGVSEIQYIDSLRCFQVPVLYWLSSLCDSECGTLKRRCSTWLRPGRQVCRAHRRP